VAANTQTKPPTFDCGLPVEAIICIHHCQKLTFPFGEPGASSFLGPPDLAAKWHHNRFSATYQPY